MILVISGTDRANSNTAKVARYVHRLFTKHGAESEILDLADLKPAAYGAGPHYGVSASGPDPLAQAVAKVNRADGIYICLPEYNGSMPGALKYFIDHWDYPKSFEFRPFAFCGLGGMFGGLRPVEHLQGSLGYRNAFIYPERVFITNVFAQLKGVEEPADPKLTVFFEKQVAGFDAFVKALQAAKLDANSREAAPRV